MCNFDGSNIKKMPIQSKDITKIDNIHPGPLGRILIEGEERLILYDMSARKVLNEISISEVKRVYWN